MGGVYLEKGNIIIFHFYFNCSIYRLVVVKAPWGLRQNMTLNQSTQNNLHQSNHLILLHPNLSPVVQLLLPLKSLQALLVLIVQVDKQQANLVLQVRVQRVNQLQALPVLQVHQVTKRQVLLTLVVLLVVLAVIQVLLATRPQVIQ